MTTDRPIIIFHRSRQNAEESLAHQQAFLKAIVGRLPESVVIDYVTGDYRQERILGELAGEFLTRSSNNITVIIQSFLSDKDYDREYNMYHYFSILKSLDKAKIYLMDQDGRLYREVKNIGKLELFKETA